MSIRCSRRRIKIGISIGAINPNIFQDQIYKHGSLGSPEEPARERGARTSLDSVEIGQRTGSRDVSLWFADGSNYPGTANIRQRRQWFIEGLKATHDRMASGSTSAGGVQAV